MNRLVKPTPEQVEWADCEVGVLIHYDIQVFHPSGYQIGDVPPPTVFQPTQLDTDQWIETAKAAGARYAVLVAKHGSGFCLWPTEAHDYSVKSSPWRNGKGDIARDFIASCARYGLRPGFYYHTGFNAYLNVGHPGRCVSGDPEEQRRYNAIVVQQLTELWTNYGELFEIWFDGGVLSPERGGPDVVPLLWRFQPQAVVFQGPQGTRSLIRWVGNEQGKAPYPCWSTISRFTGDNRCPEPGAGDPDGTIWAPAESDMPNRNHQWMWGEGGDKPLYSVDDLLERYDLSVGRNTNLLLGMVIDDRGLVPEADAEQFAAFGRAVRQRFRDPIAEASGEGDVLTLECPGTVRITQVVLMEQIAEGERVRAYILEGRQGERWVELASGTVIGHKRIERFAPMEVSAVRLRCTEFVAIPLIRRMEVYA